MRGRLGQVLYAKSHQNRIEIACVNGPFDRVEPGTRDVRLHAIDHVGRAERGSVGGRVRSGRKSV